MKDYILMKKTSAYRSIAIGLVLMVSIMACENPNQTTNASKTYFDLRGFMQNQITNLTKTKPGVKKMVMNNGKSSTKNVSVKDWEKELRMFVNSDINKTALIGTYTIKNYQGNNGGSFVKYTSKEDKNTVQSMTIELDASKKQAKSIMIITGNNNVLFSSGTQLHLTCKKDGNNQYRIASYSIKGFQKIIMREKRPYEIKAEIL